MYTSVWWVRRQVDEGGPLWVEPLQPYPTTEGTVQPRVKAERASSVLCPAERMETGGRMAFHPSPLDSSSTDNPKLIEGGGRAPHPELF